MTKTAIALAGGGYLIVNPVSLEITPLIASTITAEVGSNAFEALLPIASEGVVSNNIKILAADIIASKTIGEPMLKALVHKAIRNQALVQFHKINKLILAAKLINANKQTLIDYAVMLRFKRDQHQVGSREWYDLDYQYQKMIKKLQKAFPDSNIVYKSGKGNYKYYTKEFRQLKNLQIHKKHMLAQNKRYKQKYKKSLPIFKKQAKKIANEILIIKKRVAKRRYYANNPHNLDLF